MCIVLDKSELWLLSVAYINLINSKKLDSGHPPMGFAIDISTSDKSENRM